VEPSLTERAGWRYVLSLFLTFALTSAISVCRPASVEGRAREASQCGADTVLWCGLASGIDRRHRLWAGGRNRFKAPVEQTGPAWNCHRAGLTCPPKEAVREEAPRLFPFTTHHRAGLPFAPPSISAQARSTKLRAHRCWLFDTPPASSRTKRSADPGSSDQSGSVIPGLRSRARDP
jgi:hypothetical protein